MAVEGMRVENPHLGRVLGKEKSKGGQIWLVCQLYSEKSALAQIRRMD